MRNKTCVLGVVLLMAGCGFEDMEPPEMVSMTQARPLEKEQSLESTVRFDVGSLEITGQETRAPLYSMDLEYDRRGYAPDIQYGASLGGAEGRLSFNLHGTHRMGMRRGSNENRLRLALTDSIPLSLRVATGVGDARLSLSGMKLARIDFESGVGSAKVSAYEPNPIQCEYVRLKNGVGAIEAVGLGNLNFRELDFEGGVGGANLDFTGEWRHDADVRVQVGVGGVTVRMPREIGVRVEAEKHFLSSLQLEGFSRRNASYYSDNYDRAAIRVSIRVATGVGGLKITWI
jgi:hypothetical protein